MDWRKLARRRGPANTPLRRWRMRHKRTWESIADEAGICVRSAKRAGDGHAVSGRVALALHEVTGIRIKTLLRGCER